jgi:transposase-like protein
MGVSTRKVSEITEQLCGTEISATQVSRVASLLDEELEKFRSRPLLGEYPFVYLDAHYEKVRVDGRVQDLAILKAIGVHACGHREVLGVSARLSEAEVHWRAFLDDLASRGLKGVELLVSDDHAGLRAARRAVFPAVPWQRCQFHLSQNAQRFARRNQERRRIAQALRDIFNSPSLEDAEAMLKRKVQAFGETNQALSQWMEENVREGLTVHTFARGLHKRIRTVNALENLNKQIRRRTRVVGIFPHEASALRLISAVMAEIHDEWITGRRYLNLEDREEKEDLVPQPV